MNNLHMKHVLDDGKYTLILHDSGRLECLRYGELWQVLSGNKLVLSMLTEIDNLKHEVAQLKAEKESL